MIRIVGIGSPFGDDRAGWQVIDLLRGRLGDGIELVVLDRPGAALIDWMCGVDRLVLIDAVAPLGSPGRVHRVDPDELPPAAGISSHELGLSETIRLAEALGCRPPRLDIFGIEISGIPLDPGDTGGLSAAVADGAKRLARQLCEELPHLG